MCKLLLMCLILLYTITNFLPYGSTKTKREDKKGKLVKFTVFKKPERLQLVPHHPNPPLYPRRQSLSPQYKIRSDQGSTHQNWRRTDVPELEKDRRTGTGGEPMYRTGGESTY